MSDYDGNNSSGLTYIVSAATTSPNSPPWDTGSPSNVPSETKPTPAQHDSALSRSAGFGCRLPHSPWSFFRYW
jgi:hypothetical protein